MRLQTKIVILISILVIIFGILVLSMQYTENKKTQEILVEQKSEKLKSFEYSILSVEKTLEIFSRDYTQWTDMVNFVHHKNAVWASENIEYPLETFKANVIWILDDKFNMVYKYNNLNQSNLDTITISTKDIRTLFKKNHFNHFFIKINEQFFEIRTAPIQPTEDTQRITKPRGYFIVGRLWSNVVIEEISLMTSSTIKLEGIDNAEPDGTERSFSIKVTKIFKDWDGNPLIKLFSTSNLPFLKKSSDIYRLQMIVGLSLTFCVLLSVSIFLLVAVNKPIKIIYEGFRQQDAALLENFAKKKNEFGLLANLIIQFFNQKEKLLDEEKQRMLAETSLNKSEEKYKKMFDNSQDVFFQTALDGRILSINPSIKKYSEYAPEEVLNTNIADYYQDPNARTRFIAELQKKGEVMDFEIYFVKKSGTVIPCSVSAHFMLDENKNIIGIEGSLRDISEWKKNEEQILKLSRAVEQSPVSILITDTAGNVEYINPKFTQSSGYELNEIVKKSINILKSGLMPAELYKDLWNNISNGKEWIGELQNKKKNGELYWEVVYISPIINPENNVVTNYVAIKEDITEKKKIIEELKTAKEKAEEMNNLKSSFLANMSHELRTPMMGILGNAELIGVSTEDIEIKDMATAIYASGRRLINTLNLILDLSRVEAGRENINFEKLEVIKTIKDVIEHFNPAAKQKGLKLEFVCYEDGIYSYLDDRIFRSVLNNLINNAIKFTYVGEVKVSLNTENDNVLITITDTGIGIPANSLGLIFEEFRQVSEGYGRNFEGTGLGLTITKKFVEKLGGKISVRSELNNGSEFTIIFPCEKELNYERN
jgi:PAS domain S-box-containing protein